MNLHDALSQIADIRQQVARTQVFRGYRAATTAFTGLVAIAAACVQAMWLGGGVKRVDHYLYLWCAAAVLSMVVVGAEMTIRVRRAGSELQRDLTLAAVEQFVPCLVAGLLLTIVLAEFAFDSVWMLPGLWMILFAMGVFGSRRALPRLAGFVGGYYLLAGLVVLSRGHQAWLWPWTMGVVFGTGQLMAAGLLWYVERSNER